jgi:hypothetical protein
VAEHAALKRRRFGEGAANLQPDDAQRPAPSTPNDETGAGTLADPRSQRSSATRLTEKSQGRP